jgi:hypothetical protein
LHKPHQLKLAIWRDKDDGPIAIKLIQPYTLMEPAIIKLDSINRPAFVLVDDKLIVKTKLAFRHARQVGTHLDMAVHIGTQDRTLSAHAQVDRLYHIYERLVFLVPDIRPAPAGRTSGLARDLGRFFLAQEHISVNTKDKSHVCIQQLCGRQRFLL